MLRLATLIILLISASLCQSRAQTATFDLPFKDTVVCHGKTVTLPFTTNGIFQPGNIFTAQLSDVTGGFGNPIDIGSDTTSTSDNITVTFPHGVSVGKGYRIRLASSMPMMVSPDNGVDIRIEYIPLAPVVSNNSPVCEHDTLEVKVTNAGNTQTDSIMWVGGMYTTPVEVGGALTYNDAFLGFSGTYHITRYGLESKCASPTTTITVYVQPLPAKPVVSATPTLVCEGKAVQLNATSNPAAPGYAWNGPGGFVSALQDPYIQNIAAAGKGWYKAYSVENGCYSSKYDSVRVDVIPVPKLTITTNSPLCEGGDLQASAFDTGNITYSWKGPNSFATGGGALSIPNAPLSMSGMYYIHTLRNGCEGTDSINLRVKPYPYPTALSANSPVCEGDTLFISTVQTMQPGVVMYNFLAPNGTSLGKGKPVVPNVTIAQAGKYTLVSDIEGCSRKDSVTVVVKPTPIVTTNPEFVGTLQTAVQLLANSTIPGTGFHWRGPNGFTSNEQNPTIPRVTERNKGAYTVTGTFDGCSSEASTEVGVWYLTDYTLFQVDPNPNNGTFYLGGRVMKQQTIEIAIYHAGSSIILYKDKFESNGKLVEAKIPLPDHLAPGEYILKARADGEAHGVKFLIMH